MRNIFYNRLPFYKNKLCEKRLVRLPKRLFMQLFTENSGVRKTCSKEKAILQQNVDSLLAEEDQFVTRTRTTKSTFPVM